MRSLPCACYYSKQMKVKAQILQCFFLPFLDTTTTAWCFFSAWMVDIARRKPRKARRSFTLVPKLLPKSTKLYGCVCVCFGHVVLAIPNIPTHPHSKTQLEPKEPWKRAGARLSSLSLLLKYYANANIFI